MKLGEIVTGVEELVNHLRTQIDFGMMGLLEAEEKVLDFVNRLGGLMIEEVLLTIKEPTRENTLYFDNKVARYKDTQVLRLKTRFGTTMARPRRRYRIDGESGGYYPLDEQLGVNVCAGFTPLMTYLLALGGGTDSYERAAKTLSTVLGFGVSSTAVQSNTERTGKKLEENPLKLIDDKEQSRECDLMVVENDGTTSPQIVEEQGLTGRASLKKPTEYKECNLLVIEKYTDGKRTTRFTGGRYGPRILFGEYARKAGIKMGFLQAKTVVYLADGAKHNWELQSMHFPDAVRILDFYHALEHLGEFCALYKNTQDGRSSYEKWRGDLYEGKILRVIEDMKSILGKTTNRSEAVKHINYFSTNRERMQYDIYRSRGFPIGSGLVEGACKNVVGKRFKGSGMRWKKADNEAVLKVRLHIINETLDRFFRSARYKPAQIPASFYFCQAMGARN